MLLEYIIQRKKLPLFANARTITNAIDAARMKHADRMFNSGDKILTKADLVTIEAEDIRESSLFRDLEKLKPGGNLSTRLFSCALALVAKPLLKN
jgi:hypothetical protein